MLGDTEVDDLWQPSEEEDNDDHELEFPGAFQTQFLFIHINFYKLGNN